MSRIFEIEITSQSREDLRHAETPSNSDEHISSWDPDLEILINMRELSMHVNNQ